MSLAPVDAAMQHNMTMLTAALFLSLVASALLALWLGHRQIAPIMLIIRAARDIMGGNLSRRILLRTGDEYDVLISTLNRLTASLSHSIIEIEVQDNGIGIAPEHLPYIFDRFYRVDKARARQSGGNGIGLSLVKFLVKLFEGTIHVESEVGKGTRFAVRFPKA